MPARSLAPLPWHRLTAALRPGSLRGVTARRVLAGLLALLGALSLIRGEQHGGRDHLLVAAADLPQGRTLTADDLTVARHPADTLPDGALRDPTEAVGRALIGAVRRGEPITDVRVVSSRAAAAAAGVADARIVPVRLADAGVVDLLHDGDRVDIVRATTEQPPATATESPAPPVVLATDAAVVHVGEAAGQRTEQRIVLLALGTEQAATVGAASLTDALTVLVR